MVGQSNPIDFPMINNRAPYYNGTYNEYGRQRNNNPLSMSFPVRKSDSSPASPSKVSTSEPHIVLLSHLSLTFFCYSPVIVVVPQRTDGHEKGQNSSNGASVEASQDSKVNLTQAQAADKGKDTDKVKDKSDGSSKDGGDKEDKKTLVLRRSLQEQQATGPSQVARPSHTFLLFSFFLYFLSLLLSIAHSPSTFLSFFPLSLSYTHALSLSHSFFLSLSLSFSPSLSLSLSLVLRIRSLQWPTPRSLPPTSSSDRCVICSRTSAVAWTS